jgi:superfamily II DNA or RNA helicase
MVIAATLFTDRISAPPIPTMNLRPYQAQLVTEIRGQYQLGHKAVLAVLPTGGGKTVCFSYIAQAASVKGNRVLILSTG